MNAQNTFPRRLDRFAAKNERIEERRKYNERTNERILIWLFAVAHALLAAPLKHTLFVWVRGANLVQE